MKTVIDMMIRKPRRLITLEIMAAAAMRNALRKISEKASFAA